MDSAKPKFTRTSIRRGRERKKSGVAATTRRKRDERICLELLGVRAALQVADMALPFGSPILFHLARHALLPLQGVLKTLGHLEGRP